MQLEVYGDKACFKEKKILVVDDSPFSLSIAKSVLDRDFCRVYCVDNYLDAVRELSLNKYDLLILDWTIPDLNGGEILKFVDTSYDGYIDDIPFILYTGTHPGLIDLPYTKNFKLIDFWDKKESLDIWNKKIASIIHRLG